MSRGQGPRPGEWLAIAALLGLVIVAVVVTLVTSVGSSVTDLLLDIGFPPEIAEEVGSLVVDVGLLSFVVGALYGFYQLFS